MLKYAMLLITSIYASDVEIKKKSQWLVVTQQETTITFLDLNCNSHCTLMKYLGQTKICANESREPIGATSYCKHKFLIIRKWLFPCKVVCCKISLHGNHAITLDLKSEAQTQTLHNTIMWLKTVRFTKRYFTSFSFSASSVDKSLSAALSVCLFVCLLSFLSSDELYDIPIFK